MVQFTITLWLIIYISVILSLTLFAITIWWSGNRRYNF